jgi:hypothetical protein
MRAVSWVAILGVTLVACGGSPAGGGGNGGGDAIQLRPGDDVYIAGDEAGGALTNLRVVGAPATPASVVHMAFARQTVGGSASLLLHVDNFFATTLVYHSSFEDVGQANQVNTTSTCPVSPGLSALELWPDPIAVLTVRDFAFRDANDGICAYY